MRMPKLSSLRYKQPSWLPLAASFGIPVLGMLLMMLFSGYMPFGKHAMLYSDMWHQYYPFFVNFRKMLVSGDSLLYNWDLGMGLNYVGLIAYYLASPLNLLCLLLPEHLSLYVFTCLPPLKMGIAGLCFGLFLKKVFHKNDLSIALFASLYALCAWALGYQWNLMWLDSFALLPLVMLGMVQLLREQKFVLYTVSLFLAVSVNYYVGFFLCLFVILSYLCYEVSYFTNVKAFLKDTGRILLYSLLAAGMCAVVLLPMFSALQTTYSANFEFPEGFYLNIVADGTYDSAIDAWEVFRAASADGSANVGMWLDALWKSIGPVLDGMRTVLGNQNGGVAPALMDAEGLPNIFCGVITNLLAYLFLFCRRIRLRERLCAVVLLLFFNASFIIRQLDYIWHGFHFPNSIPYRFSFLYSFVLLYMAYRAWCQRRSFRVWQVATALMLCISQVLISQTFRDSIKAILGGTALPSMWIYPIYNFLLLLVLGFIFLATLCPWKKPENRQAVKGIQLRRRIGSYSILAVMLIEVALSLVNFNSFVYNTYHYSSYSTDYYPKNAQAVQSMIRVMEDLENGENFYRAEVTHTQTLNDSALNGYSGISLFSSSANAATTTYLRAMGLTAQDRLNRYTYKDGSPVTNMFLNLKYLLHRGSNPLESLYFDKIHSYEDVHLLRNNHYLPLGFMVRPELADLALPTGQVNHFTFQNQFMRSATGWDEDIWLKWPEENLEITGEQAEIVSHQLHSGFSQYQVGDAGGKVIYTYTVWQDGQFCIDMHLGKNGDINVYKIPKGQEDSDFLFSESYKTTQMLNCGAVQAGDKIRVVVTYEADESSTMIIRGAIVNDDMYNRAFAEFSEGALHITHFENAYIKGTVNCTQAGLLYTSVPQDGNWKAYVDGKEATIKLVGDAMIGLELAEGTHTVELRYKNKALDTGFTIALLSLAVFSCICFFKYGYPKIKNRKR